MKHLSLLGLSMFVLLAILFNPLSATPSYAVLCELDESSQEQVNCPDATHRCVQEGGKNTCKELCPRGNASGSVCGTNQVCNSQNKCVNVSNISPSNPDGTAGGGGIVPCGGSGQASCQLRDLFVLLHNILEFAIFQLAPILVTVMVAVGGFKMLIAAGNPGKYGEGVSLIKNALIGYGIVLVSMLLVNTILQQIGVAQWTGLLDWEIINF